MVRQFVRSAIRSCGVRCFTLVEPVKRPVTTTASTPEAPNSSAGM